MSSAFGFVGPRVKLSLTELIANYKVNSVSNSLLYNISAVADAVRTSLGPRGMDKMVIICNF